MKVLAVMGSPRKTGNSFHLTQRVENSMKELGDIDFEQLFLVDADLKPCRGCFTCFMKGSQYCPVRDDHGSVAMQDRAPTNPVPSTRRGILHRISGSAS